MRSWALAAVALGLPGMAAAQPASEDLSDLQGALDAPLVSTASQMVEDASVAPATFTSLSADELRRYGIRSLDEAINFLSLGMLTQNPLHSVDVGARGVLLTSDFGNHVLLLVNGHAMNEGWDGTAYFERGAAIPFELIDHIEIVLGPGSVLYGSNAMVGVVNIITKRARDWSGYHVVAESELPTSIRGGLGLGRELTLFGMPAALTVALEYYGQWGPDFTFGPQPYGDDAVTMMPKKFNPAGTNAGAWGGVADRSYFTRIPTGYARLEIGRLSLDLRAATYKRATPYVNQFNQFTGDFNDPDNWEQDRFLSLDARHELTLSAIAALRSHVYGDLYEYRQEIETSAAEDCLDGQTSGCRRHTLGLSRWAGLEEQLALDWGKGGLVTLLGADGRIRHAGQQLEVEDASTGETPPALARVRRTEYAVGVYVQQTARPTGFLDLSAGARFDADERFGTHLSPRGAVALGLWAGARLKAIYAEAFRAPTIYELHFADPSDQVAALELRPESVRSVEALVEQRLGRHRLLLGAFRSSWKDMVMLEDLDDEEIAAAVAAGTLLDGVEGAVQYRNAARIENHGADAALEGALLGGDLRYGFNFTVARAKRRLQDGGELDLTVTPKWFGNARLSYDLPGALPVLAVAGSFVGRRLADRAHDGGFTPVPAARAQLELRGTVSGVLPWVSGLSYRVSANLAFRRRNPYVVGPTQAATAEQPKAQLSPVDRFRLTLGLQYDFGN